MKNIDFVELLVKAIKNVDVSYQSIITQGLGEDGEMEFARERVYCYELYHQLRLIFGAPFYNVNGEIDKRGHVIITDGFNPDIVIHKQGCMKHNELVIEAKIRWKNDDVEKDFNTLNKMTTCYGYKRGIFLFIGSALPEIKAKIKELGNKIHRNEKIDLICVKDTEVERCTLSSIFEQEQ